MTKEEAVKEIENVYEEVEQLYVIEIDVIVISSSSLGLYNSK